MTAARETTLQALDPLGALAGRPLTVVGAGAAVVVALSLSAAGSRDVSSPLLAVAALAVLAGAGAMLSVLSAAKRAPFTRQGALVVVAGGLLAHILNVAALWERNTLVRDDWGPAALGMLLLCLCPYRPPAEIARLSVGAAAVLALVTLLQQPFFVTSLPLVAYVVIAVVPVLALGLGGAAFAHRVLGRLAAWRERAVRSSAAHAATLQEGIVRSVQQGRVSILNRDVVPFFASITERSELTAEDQRRASEIADAIRSVMVAETERTWLDELLVPVPAGTEQTVWPRVVDDPARLVDAMDFDQRAAVRALVGALTFRGGLDPHAVRALVAGRAGTAEVTMRIAGRTDLEPALAPYVAVMRAVFAELTLTTDPDLTLRFTYDVD
ncbi:MAG: hypothetical protein JWP66_1009 [Naasia sp.]|nr:hypothetical protein [Naasia sp.]